MAGGMDRPGAPRPAWLREHHREATRPLEGAAGAEGLGAAREHCWVQGPEEAPGPWPGVVVQWRRDAEGWTAQVAYVVVDEPPVLVAAWVSGSALRPA